MNKQGQWSIKTAIKVSMDLVRFGIEGQNLGTYLEKKVHENQFFKLFR